MQAFGSLSREQWHQRYQAQAGWTAHIREHILNQVKPHITEHILEVGSGTGAIVGALQQNGFLNITGVDLDLPSLVFSKQNQPEINSTSADGHYLPFSQSEFGISLCHYLLMWARNPEQILREMHRVTRSGGWVLALAEPDHQARIDYPPPLDVLGKLQTQALLAQGADICIGRKLRALFIQCGLTKVEVGILAAQWHITDHAMVDETEWAMLRADLNPRLTESELAEFQLQDRQAWQIGERVLYVPTFYALGKVP